MNIFIAKLSRDTDSDSLTEAFSNYGEVVSSKVIIDKLTGFSKGYGFVEMSSEEDGQNAINALDGSELDGRTIVVKKSAPKEKRY